MERVRRTKQRLGASGGLADGLVVAGAGLLVVAVSLWQWGLGTDGLLRGLTLGTWLAVFVAIALRRRRARAAQEAAAREALRVSIARELHDTVAGRVAAIGLQAAGARRVLSSRPTEAAAALGKIEDEARAANADLRRMLDALRDGKSISTSAAPGLTGLATLLDRATPGADEDVGEVTLDMDPVGLDAVDTALGQAAYRIIDEAVRNARAHAVGAPISVSVRARTGLLELEVVNGPGRRAAAWPGSGMGVIGMRERAELFGGTVDTGPTGDGGYRVLARLPLGTVGQVRPGVAAS